MQELGRIVFKNLRHDGGVGSEEGSFFSLANYGPSFCPWLTRKKAYTYTLSAAPRERAGGLREGGAVCLRSDPDQVVRRVDLARTAQRCKNGRGYFRSCSPLHRTSSSRNLSLLPAMLRGDLRITAAGASARPGQAVAHPDRPRGQRRANAAQPARELLPFAKHRD